MPESEQTREPTGSTQVLVDPDLLFESPLLAEILVIWTRLRGDGAMPMPGDIDPVDLPRDVLPHLLLVDVEHAPSLRFRWRLIGTYATRILGRDMTGRYWDEIYDERTFQRIAVGLEWVLRHRLPVRTLGTAPDASEHFVRSESAIMPLSSDGRTIDRMLGAVVYDVAPC
ncbi:MAG: PAS domain-containing protein [Thalassobaculum sp.]|uniref:PAS domain-containing protein n=1 Tax=Thalassobaculum sp. TaxID=2022740 RepID=UPI0032EE46C1